VKWNPHPYQKKVAKFCLGQGAAGLFLEPGLGKTSIILSVIKTLMQQNIVKKTLVVCPLRVAYNVWGEEVNKWDEFKHLRVVVLHGPEKERWLHSDADIYVINVDGLDWLARQMWQFDVLVLDESTLVKNPQTKRFKILRALLKRFKRRYILTGTPVPNGYLNLFGQIYVLDGGAALGRYITHYRQEYFAPSGYQGYQWKLREGSEERINAKLRPLVMRLAAEDYLELPPLVTERVEVTLPKKVRKTYDALEADFIAQIGDLATITAVNAAAMSSKCRQVANGGAYADGGKIVDLHTLKVDAVRDLVEELGGAPVLVLYDTKHDVRRLQKAFKDAPYIDGDVTPKKTTEILHEWNAGRVPVLLAHPVVIAHGLNMQAGGRHMVWHSLTWDLETYLQAIDRLYRQGQTGKVFVYHVVARGTIDELMLERLEKKKSVQDALLDALKETINGKKKRAA